ncbi:MAG: tetratricopeptide repeat protein, partial [Candidatus Electrothrix sp. AUS1_2]|nr:tetratricopeptide repeat protein [Candidatus Electrothrix sp. AUS1_2]
AAVAMVNLGGELADVAKDLPIAAADRLAAVREDLEGRANEFLLKARLSLLNPVAEGEDRFRRTEGYFEQALAAARTAEVLFEYAYFLVEQNASRAEPLYQEALQLLRSKAEADPKAFLSDVATTLNNLALLHVDTGAFASTLTEYEEALTLNRRLAEDDPNAYLPDVAMTLNNLATLHKDTGNYCPALAEYEEALKIRRDLARKEPDAFLQDVAMTLNNLANLHRVTNNYGPALTEYEEALKIRRDLAEKEPEAFSQVLAETLLNLGIFYLQAMPDKDKSVAYAQEARKILLSLIKQAPHLQGHLDQAEQLLEDNKARPGE